MTRTNEIINEIMDILAQQDYFHDEVTNVWASFGAEEQVDKLSILTQIKNTIIDSFVKANNPVTYWESLLAVIKSGDQSLLKVVAMITCIVLNANTPAEKFKGATVILGDLGD